MSDVIKPNADMRVSITNKPSGRNSHSKGEWIDHIHLREEAEARWDIREARAKLGNLTVRSFAETFCYDDPQVRDYILSQLDGDELIGDIKIDEQTLKKLADRVGGKKAHGVVQRSTLKEIPDEPVHEVKTEQKPQKSVSDEQVELLRALLRTMDPEVVKRAFTGE